MPRLTVATLALCALVAACADSRSPAGPDERVLVEEGQVVGTGTILYTSSFGGFFYLRTADGTLYIPMNLPDEYRRPGLRVDFRGVERSDVVTRVMMGTPFEIRSITWRR